MCRTELFSSRGAVTHHQYSELPNDTHALPFRYSEDRVGKCNSVIILHYLCLSTSLLVGCRGPIEKRKLYSVSPSHIHKQDACMDASMYCPVAF